MCKSLEGYIPDIVGVTCMFTITHESFSQTIRQIKSFNKNIVIFAGGVHITNDPGRIKEEIPEIDFLIPHESESRFVKLLTALNSYLREVSVDKIQNSSQEGFDAIGNSSEKKIDVVEEVVSSSIPDYCDLDISRYSEFGEVGAYRFFWRENTKAATIQEIEDVARTALSVV